MSAGCWEYDIIINMNPHITEFSQNLQKTVSALKEDLKSIRTGRANPSMVEEIPIEAYGGQSKMRLLELATIITEGPSLLVIMPFDPSTIPDIERGILKSPMGFSPQTQGTKINIRIPPLSQEQREKYIKLVGQKVEERKVMARNLRDDVRKKIKTGFEAKEITEDEKYRLEKEIDSLIQKSSEEFTTLKEKKEQEIREV